MENSSVGVSGPAILSLEDTALARDHPGGRGQQEEVEGDSF